MRLNDFDPRTEVPKQVSVKEAMSADASYESIRESYKDMTAAEKVPITVKVMELQKKNWKELSLDEKRASMSDFYANVFIFILFEPFLSHYCASIICIH